MAVGQLEPVDESDETLVVRVTQGDEIAFREIYERFFKRIYLFVDKRLSRRRRKRTLGVARQLL